MVGVLRRILLALSVLLLVSAAPTPESNPVAAGGVSVQGTVRAVGQPLPPDVVVYLEAVDPSVHFEVPKRRVRVSQKGAQFSPALTVVCVGQTVDFVNDEDRPIEHNVFSNAANARFDLGLFPPGESRPVSFDQSGPVVLACSIHKFMDGAVYVCPNPLFSRVDNDGSYRIDGVPPGQYTIKTWQRRRRFPEVSMTIGVSGATMTQDLELKRK
jgi:plastocyanin